MSRRRARKMGFWMALAMVAGSVIGVGIFFKNGFIFRENDGNGVSALLTWVLGGVVALCAAISFSEIGTTRWLSISGLPGWAEKVGGTKFGYFVRFNYTFFYHALFTTVFGVFVSEAFFQGFVVMGVMNENPDIWVHILMALFFIALSLFTNLKSSYASGIVQIVTTSLKFVPIVLAIMMGLVMATTHNGDTTSTGVIIEGTNAFTNNTKFNLNGLVTSLPAVLFAYDTFLSASAMGDKVEGGEETVKKSMVIGMISVTVIYILVAVASGLHTGVITDPITGKTQIVSSIQFLMMDTLPQSARAWITATIWFFVAISAYSVQNGLAAAYVSNGEQMMMKTTFYGQTAMIRKFGMRSSTIYTLIGLSTFSFIYMSSFALATNSGAIIDVISNIPTLFAFVIYAIVILLYAIDRDKYPSTKINKYLFHGCAWTAVVLIFAIFGYLIVWEYFGEVIVDPFSQTSHQLLDNGGLSKSLVNWQEAAIIWGTLAWQMILCLINWVLMTKKEDPQTIVFKGPR